MPALKELIPGLKGPIPGLTGSIQGLRRPISGSKGPIPGQRVDLVPVRPISSQRSSVGLRGSNLGLRSNFVHSCLRRVYSRPRELISGLRFQVRPQVWERSFHAWGIKFSPLLVTQGTSQIWERPHSRLLNVRGPCALCRPERAYMRDEKAHLRHEMKLEGDLKEGDEA